MSAWTKFATQFFHNKQKQNPDYKFSQALKEASKLYKKTKGGSRKQQGGGLEKKYKIENNAKVECLTTDPEFENSEICKSSDEIDVDLTLSGSNNESDVGTNNTGMNDGTNKTGMNDGKTPTLELGGKKGGRKSQKKSKKAGKKSQKKSKKAKKAGSKKSKK